MVILLIRREKKIKRIFFTTLFLIAILLSNVQILNNTNKLQDDKINNTFNENLLDNLPLSSDLNLDDNIKGSGVNQDVRIYVSNQSENLQNNEGFFEIPSVPSEDMFLTYGDFNFTFQNNFTTNYIIEDDDALYANDFISFDYNSGYSSVIWDAPDTQIISGGPSDLMDGVIPTYILMNATQGVLNFTISANFTDTTYTSGIINGNVEFNRSKILGLISSLIFELIDDANLTVRVRDYSQSNWKEIISALPINSSLGRQELRDHIINENLNFIDLSDTCFIRFIFERDDQSPFLAELNEYDMKSTYAFDLPITNSSYVALEMDLKGLNSTVNGFYAWIRTLDILEAANTHLNITLYRANDTVVRTDANLRNIDLGPNYNEMIDSVVVNGYTGDEASYFEFDNANTNKLNLSNYFIVIKTNRTKQVYSLVTLPFYDYGDDGSTEHQLKTTNNAGVKWTNAKKVIETTVLPYISDQLDASSFKLNVTRGYMPSDFIIGGNNTLRIQNMTIENVVINSYPYNESSFLTWGLGQWTHNFSTPIEDDPSNNFRVDFTWNSSITKGFKFVVTYSVNAYWIENALATYSVNYDEDPKWIFEYILDKTQQKFDNWSYMEFWYVYPNYFTAKNLTNPNYEQILNQIRGQSVLSEDPTKNKIIVPNHLTILNGIYSLNLTGFNFINNMHSYINYNNSLLETNGFMFGDNISVSVEIQDQNFEAPISGYANVTLFYPNGTKYLNAELNSSAGTIKGSMLFYDFNNQTIINLTSAITVFGEYHLGFFWFNGSAIGCKELNIYIVSDLNTTTSWILDPFVIDDSGQGDYTWATALLYPWCTGSGSWADPYIIENLIINGQNSGSCIEIRNSNVFFTIKNCLVYNSGSGVDDAGIKLNVVINGQLIDNNCSNNNGVGIGLYQSQNITINGNIVNNNIESGISLEASHNNKLLGNTLNENFDGMLILASKNNTITENSAINNDQRGIYLSSLSNNNTFINNNLTYNGEGMYVSYSHNNTFIGNNAEHNDYGIFIWKSNNTTVARNIASYNTNTGLYLWSSNNTKVIGNVFNGNFLNNIQESECENNIIKFNYMDGSLFSPVIIDDDGGGDFTWSEAKALFSWCTGSGSYSDPYIIQNLIIDGQNSSSCIEIRNSKVYFIIRNCTLFNSREEWSAGGIKFYKVSNGTLLNNNCSYNNWNGIFIYYSDSNQVINCTTNNNTYGIKADFSNYCNFSGNIVNDNLIGIFLEGNNHSILNNNVNYNSEAGIMTQYGNHSVIIRNSASNNGAGIWLNHESNKFKVLNNSVRNNQYVGINVYNSNESLIYGNNISNNSQEGIFIRESDNNTITGNIIINNPMDGIYIDFSENCLFFNNTFINNGNNALDHGSNNNWDNGTIGNYWDDYSGLDQDDNGIGDTPYYISGTAGARDNFPIWDDGLTTSWILDPFVIYDPGGGDYTWAEAILENWCQGSGSWNNPYIIENVTINGRNSSSCLIIRNSNIYFIIKNCTFYNSSNGIHDAGIKLEDVNKGKLININSSNNNGNGIVLDNCQNISIEENSMNYNSINGIVLQDSFNNSIVNNRNTINNNGNHGINLVSSNNNTISGNIINYNSIGIFLSESNDNNITSNDLRYNDKAYEEIDCEGNLFENNLGSQNSSPIDIIMIIVIVSILIIALSGGTFSIYILKKRKGDTEQKNLIKIEKKKQRIRNTLQKRMIKIENFIQENKIEKAINKLKEYEITAATNDLNEIIEEIQAKINHCNNLNLNRINRVKRIILELATKFTRLQIVDIVERSDIHNEDFIIKIIQEMIANKEIYAEFFSTSKAVAFDQQKNIDQIDVLMETNKELEEVDMDKKIEIPQEIESEITSKEEKAISPTSILGEIPEFNLFLSYSTLDAKNFDIKKTAESLELFPEINKVLFWEVDSSANIVEFMEETLRKTNVFILFCSENSQKSKAVRDEWQAAFQLRKKDLMKIIPIYEKEEHIPYLLTPLLNVKFQKDNFKEYIQKLYNEILRT